MFWVVHEHGRKLKETFSRRGPHASLRVSVSELRQEIYVTFIGKRLRKAQIPMPIMQKQEARRTVHERERRYFQEKLTV
jgi:hypothetical protein